MLPVHVWSQDRIITDAGLKIIAHCIIINKVIKHTQYKTYNHIWQHIRGSIEEMTD